MIVLDRDPDQMMKYSNDMMESVGRLVTLIKATEALLDTYAHELDKPSQDEIKELHECCNAYYNSIQKILNGAEDIYNRGKKLKIVRERG